MLSEERKVKIMQLIRRDGFVTVKQLMDMLDASRSSIMRDLDELEASQLVVRQRGGASLRDTAEMMNPYNEPTVFHKEHEQADQKRKICQKAAKVVEDGNCIYVDTGTSVLHLVEELANKDVTIVSANLHFLSHLPDDFKGKVYVLGGEYSKKYDSNYGDMTVAMMNQFYFDHAFLTANGVDWTKEEVYAYNMSYGTMKKKAIERSRRIYLLADATKVGQHGPCVWANTNDFDAIYMDAAGEMTDASDNLVICE